MEIKNYENVLHAIQKKVGNIKCPVCGKLEGFNVEPTEFHLVSYERNGLKINFNPSDFRFSPVVQVTCKHCGYVMNFNLKVLLDDKDYLSR